MRSIFDRALRGDDSPRRVGEGTYRFLNRVGGAQWDEVRAVIESWWAALPSPAREDVRGRLRSGDQQFGGAWWELYLFASLRGAGFDVRCHPPVPGTSRRPDFLAESGSASFYVEARYVSAAEHVAVAEGQMRRLRQALDGLRCPEEFLRVAVARRGTADVRLRPLLRGIQAWLDTGDRQEREFSDGAGWSLRVAVIPRPAQLRGAPGVPALSTPGGLRDDTAPLRRALNSKSGRYGILDRPLVLAVNQQEPIDPGPEATSPAHPPARIGWINGAEGPARRSPGSVVLLASNLDHRNFPDVTPDWSACPGAEV